MASDSSNSVLTTTAVSAGRLDAVLAQAFPDVSRSRFQRLIRDGHVRVADVVADDGARKVIAGDVLIVAMPPAVDPLPTAEKIALTIVFEDKHLIVIDKPAGLVVHPGAGNETGTLVNALIAHCGDSLSGIGGVKRPGIVHRIDKETSGLLVVAKTDKAHQGLSEQFAAHGRDGRLERSYIALVWGLPPVKGTIHTGLERSSANRQKMAVSKSATAREAITHFDRAESFGAPPVASLVHCNLETGRTHQIRVHMAHIGHPLLGDVVYGGGFKSSKSKLSEAALRSLSYLRGQALHAAVLGFDHPVTGKHLRFESKLPEAMARLKAALKGG
jgi:23S rRNA pseudouridine1911/1915/1917 synthase